MYHVRNRFLGVVLLLYYEPKSQVLFYPLMHRCVKRTLSSILKYGFIFVLVFNFQIPIRPASLYLTFKHCAIHHCSEMAFLWFNTCIVKEFKWSWNTDINYKRSFIEDKFKKIKKNEANVIRNQQKSSITLFIFVFWLQ